MAGDRWLTFDCYGTIADWDACMRTALAPVAGSGSARLLAAYHQAELTLEAESAFRPYRDVLVAGLRMAARRLGINLAVPDVPLPAPARVGADAGADDPTAGTGADAGTGTGADAADPAMAFVRAWPDMTLFADAVPALRELAADGWKLGILTNCDDDLFATTASKFPVPFDVLVTAQQVRSYKPDLGHFRKFAEITGATPENWIHVANSWVHDILPAARMGLRSVWVDRDLTGHPAKVADRRITAMRRLPETVADVYALPLPGA